MLQNPPTFLCYLFRVNAVLLERNRGDSYWRLFLQSYVILELYVKWVNVRKQSSLRVPMIGRRFPSEKLTTNAGNGKVL